jgi:hypothetical protein
MNCELYPKVPTKSIHFFMRTQLAGITPNPRTEEQRRADLIWPAGEVEAGAAEEVLHPQ